MPRPVTIVDHDPQWPILYEEEKSSILEVADQKILAIEHIGSTAVPGLAAKPILDIMAGVEGEADADECVRLLRSIGYDDVTPEPETPDWYYCLGKGFYSVGYHLHLARHGSASLQASLRILQLYVVMYRRYGLSVAIMLHSYDYISLFVPFVDIPVSLDNLFQRIASIYDRFYLSRLNKLFEEN